MNFVGNLAKRNLLAIGFAQNETSAENFQGSITGNTPWMSTEVLEKQKTRQDRKIRLGWAATKACFTSIYHGHQRFSGLIKLLYKAK